MDDMFSLELSSDTSGTHRYAELTLPATDYELLDVMEKLQVQDDSVINCEILTPRCSSLLSAQIPDSPRLFELNELARCLGRFDEAESLTFEGLLQMEVNKKAGAIDMETLLLLAGETKYNCCHVVPEAMDDARLGRFYAENGFIPAVESVPDSIFELLDFKSLGRRARMEEGGVFVPHQDGTSGGYVVKHSDPKLDRPAVSPPERPDYIMLLDLKKGDCATRLRLPASPAEMDAALNAIRSESWSGVRLRCLDSAVPAFIGSFQADDNIAHINRLVQKIWGMDSGQLTKFKAVLDAAEDFSVLGATDIAYHLEDYLYAPQYADVDDMAADFLRSNLGEAGFETLRPYINLYGYGAALMEEQQCCLTSYGMVSREDGQSLKPNMEPAEPDFGGMEMM